MSAKYKQCKFHSVLLLRPLSLLSLHKPMDLVTTLCYSLLSQINIPNISNFIKHRESQENS